MDIKQEDALEIKQEELIIEDECIPAAPDSRCTVVPVSTENDLCAYEYENCTDQTGAKSAKSTTGKNKVSSQHKYYCAHCTFATKQKRNLSYHVKRHLNKHHLQKYLKILTSEKPYQCEQCHYKTVYKFNLKLHLRVHTDNGEFWCYICKKRCKDKSYLRKHVLIHIKKEQSLPNDSIVFNSMDDLIKEEATEFNNLMDRFMIVSTSNENGLKSHEYENCTDQTGEKPYRIGNQHKYYCAHCKFATNQKRKLSYHVKRHLQKRHKIQKHVLIHIKESHSQCRRTCSTNTNHEGTTANTTLLLNPDIVPSECNAFNFMEFLIKKEVSGRNSLTNRCTVLSTSNENGLKTNEYKKCNNQIDAKSTTGTGEKPDISTSKIANQLKYYCADCTFTTDKKRKLTYHIKRHLNKRHKIHTTEKLYQCDQCNYKTIRKDHLQRHHKTHAAKKLYQCKLCDFKTIRNFDLETHKKIHTGENPYQCDQCNYQTIRKHDLQKHHRTHTGEKPYLCKQCDYKTIRKDHLQQHHKTHTGEKPYKCEQCDFQTVYKYNLKTHLRIHTGNVVFWCYICKKRFKSKSYLRKHVLIHIQERHFQRRRTSSANTDHEDIKGDTTNMCMVVSTSNENSENCTDQTGAQSTTDEKSYKIGNQHKYYCAYCTFITNQKRTLSCHLQKHHKFRTGGKPYQCGQCDYKTKRKNHLRQHHKTHTGEKPYQCKQCDFKTIYKYNLKLHLRVHSGEGGFWCFICKKRFKSKSYLRKHVLIHQQEHNKIRTGGKPYQCGQCDYKTMRKIHLRQHHKTHTGEKPYQCEQCDFKTIYKYNLKLHLRVHTGEGGFWCYICKKRFKSKSYLRKHLLIHIKERHSQRSRTCSANIDYEGTTANTTLLLNPDIVPNECNAFNFMELLIKEEVSGLNSLTNRCNVLSTSNESGLKTEEYENCNNQTDAKSTIAGKLYQCDQCNYKTIRNDHLQRHHKTHTLQNPYQCKLCDFKTIKKFNLQKHHKIHTGENPYQCDQCDYQTVRKNDLQKHHKTHTGEKPYQCQQCDYKSIRKDHLRQHQKIHSGEKPYQCEQCDFQTVYKYNLKPHLKVHIGEGGFRCYICKKRFKSKSYLRKHVLIHIKESHSQRRRTCSTNTDYEATTADTTLPDIVPNECNAFNFVEVLIKEEENELHSLTNRCTSIENGLKTEECEKSNNQTDAKSTTGTGENPYETKTKTRNQHKYHCDHCTFTTKRKRNLLYHIKHHFNKRHLQKHQKTHSGKKPYQCQQCDYKTIRKHNLQQHYKIHTGEKPYQCEQCDYKTVYKFNLKSHRTVHTGNDEFCCDICKKCFRYKSSLRKHVWIHIEERHSQHKRTDLDHEDPDIVSNECNVFNSMDFLITEEVSGLNSCTVVSTSTENGLKTDKYGNSNNQTDAKIHTAEKPYQCDQCNYKTIRKHNLQQHHKIHTGDKPYQCEQCDYKTVYKFNLNSHLKVHTDNGGLWCYICMKRFKDKSHLRKHVLIHIKERHS